MLLNNDNSYNLAVTGDALLPKLLSGDIRLKDAKNMVEIVLYKAIKNIT